MEGVSDRGAFFIFTNLNKINGLHAFIVLSQYLIARTIPIVSFSINT